MALSLQTILLDKTLKASSRELSKTWLLTNTTSEKRFKAGLPAGWRVADKTGTSQTGNVNDVGLLYTPDNGAIVIAAFVSESNKSTEVVESALAEVAKLVAAELDSSL